MKQESTIAAPPVGCRYDYSWMDTATNLAELKKIAADPAGRRGRWFWDQHELLILARRGNAPAPLPGTQDQSVFDAAGAKARELRLIAPPEGGGG
jgi:hypothetical protein